MKGFDNNNQARYGHDVVRVAAWTLFFAISIIVAFILLKHCLSYLTFEMPLDDGEGFVLNQAKMISEGKSPYHPIDTPPFIVTNYPPVYIGILAILVKLFGIKLTLGRIISFIAGLGIIRLCFSASRQRDGKGALLPSLIAPALFAATPVVYFWMPLCRIDMFANFLSLAAIFVAWRFASRLGLYWSLPILWLALYTRQSAIEGFVVIAVMLFLQRRKELARFMVIYVAGALLIFMAFYLAYGPEFFRHLTTYTKTNWYFSRLIASYEIIFAGAYFPTAIGHFRTAGMLLPTAIAVFASWRLWRDKDAQLWIIYFITGFLLTILVGKVGSAPNYFLPMFIPQAIIIGIWVSREYNSANTPRGIKNALVAGMALLVAYMGFVINDRIGSFEPTEVSKSNGELLIQIVNSFEGPVFLEDEGLTLLAEREVIYTPFIMNELNKEGLWDQTMFLNTFQRAEYELIILRFDVFDRNLEDVPELGDWAGWDRFSPEMEEAIRRNYYLIGRPIEVRRSWYLYTRLVGGPTVNLVFEKD